MKANFLFGIQFAKDPNLKSNLLKHYTGWKLAKINSYHEERKTQIIQNGLAMGFSREHLEAEFDLDASFSKQQPDFSEVETFITEEQCRHYYVTKPVISICQRLRVKEPFDLAWLAPIQDGKRQFNYMDGFIRYEKKGFRILVMAAGKTLQNDNSYFQYTFFNLNIDTKIVAEKEYPEDYDDFPEQVAKDFDEASRRLFFQLITFIELAPIEEIFLPAGRKNGTRKSEDGVFNDAGFPITIINTNWNRVIRVGKIDVDGHFRLQAWGPKYTYRRLTWISEYSKSGYNVSALKNKPE